MSSPRLDRRPWRWVVLLVPGLVLAPWAAPVSASTNFSAWVYPGPSGRLLQQPDALGNRVLDYSGVGYKAGMAPLPNVPVKVTLSPVAGDDGASIQAAINQVSAMPLDTNGFRGAVLLTAGEYQISNSITINASGVVLRGVGDETDGTVLRAAGAGQRTLVKVTGSGSAATVSGTTHSITDYYVPVGSRSFNVNSTSGLAVGDRVFVQRIATDAWIHDLGMDLLCCPPDVNPWTASGYNIDSDRVITRIEGSRITLDAPITCAIEQRYAGGTIRKYTWPGRIQNVGIEYLRGVSDFVAADDEDHGWILIQMNSVENAWVRHVTSQYFGYACVALYNGTKWATVTDCRSLDPVSIVTGGRRYAFVMDDNRFCLVQNCYTVQDRHQFVTQSLTTGPNVFVDGLSDTARSDAGPHHRWATGALWDNITVNGNNLNIQNRGNLGSGHGWAGANCAVWNADADGGYVVQNPPGAHNWLIGSIGAIENGTVYVGPHDPGTYDSHGSNVFPNSLYYAQLQDRLAAPGLQTREYWAGDIDAFTNNTPGGEAVPVDAAWLTAVQTAAGAQAVDGFDIVTNNHWVPFTFSFSLSPNEHVVAATLSLSLRAQSAASADDVLYLDSLTNGLGFAGLGWLPISTTTNPSVRVLDLAGWLSLLADGQLNVAVQNDVGVDWALLELQVAPNVNAGTFALLPVADATVRGGASANSNFGTATTLTVKEDAAADNDRKAYLRWDLSGVTGILYQARIRLTPVSVGTNAIEQGATICANHAWSETAITWNNQPGGGKRFASWIPGANAPLEFAVTPQVLEALAGDKQLSVQLYSLRNFGAAGTVDYASREAADAGSRPQLLLTVSELPPSISEIANRSIAVNASTGPIPFTVADDKTAAADLVVSGASSNTNLVPNESIVFGGSDSNRTVTVTPALNQSGIAVITVTVTDTAGLSSSDSFNLTVSSHPPAVFIWNGPGAGANPWSAGGNWVQAGPPETLDDVKFFDPGGAGVGVSNINNAVDGSFGGTIASLQYGPTNGNHTTLIATGRTLTIAGTGGLTVGTGTDNGNGQVVQATITGAGVLNVAGGDLIVRQATDGASGGSQRATLEMSGLDGATMTVGRVMVGSEGSFARVTGTLTLARTNTIVAAGTAPAIAIGGLGGGSGNAGGASFLYLGRTNAIMADSLAVGRGKQGISGGAPSSLRFRPAFTNANPALGAMVWLRGADGLSRMASWSIADSGSGGGTVNTAGACDFSGGMVDAKVGTITLGKTSSGSGNGNPTGTLTMNAGTLDVNTLQLGYQSVSGTNFGTGIANIFGGSLRVNAALEMGHVSGGVGATNTAGALMINGGAAFVNALVAGPGSGTNTISLNNGTLAITNTAGTPAAPIASVTLGGSTLVLNGALNVTNLVTVNLATGPGANTVVVGSLPVFPAYPAQLKLVQYSNTIGGAGYNFVLAPLPAGSYCGGYLSNNAAASSVDLVVTNCTVPDPFLTWDGAVDGDWDTKTANWKNNLGGGLIYGDGNSVVFDDTATGATNINLTDILTPGSVTVNNAAKTYTFVDQGKLSGGANLRKQGAGTLVIANEGNNDFTGGVVIEGGTLRVGGGGTNGTLPAGSVVNSGSLIFNRSDDFAVAGAISGAGAVVKTGTGTATLTSANSFSGAATITQGTLKIGNNTALGVTNGGTTVANGATLDLNHFNIGLEPVSVLGAGVGAAGAIVDNSGNGSFLSPQSLAYVTLTGDTTFGGTGRWDLRSASTTATNAALSTTGHPYKLTKVGTNQVSLVAVLVDPALGDIEVQAGTLSVEKVITSLGNPASTLAVSNRATLQFYQVSNVLSKVLVLGDGATVFNNNGMNTFGGPVRLLGSNTFNVGGTWMRLTNALSGPGSLVKVGASALVLSGAGTYTGSTIVNAGTLALTNNGTISGSTNITVAAGATLDVSGRADGRLALASGERLDGKGTIAGSLLVNPGATVAPGESVGALTVNGTVDLQGTTAMELDRPNLTNDVIRGASAVTYGGTLSLSFAPGTLAAGDAFTLFDAATYTGAFANIVPAIPGAGLTWDTSLLTTSGTLRVVSAPAGPPTIGNIGLAGDSVVISGSGGTPGAPYYVLASADVAAPVANWTRLFTNTFDASGNFSFTNVISAGVPQRFYRLEVP